MVHVHAVELAIVVVMDVLEVVEGHAILIVMVDANIVVMEHVPLAVMVVIAVAKELAIVVVMAAREAVRGLAHLVVMEYQGDNCHEKSYKTQIFTDDMLDARLQFELYLLLSKSQRQ